MAAPKRPAGTVFLPRLRRLREAKFLSQADLAERAHVARYSIQRIEQGHSARWVTARRLAEALGVAPQELVEPEAEGQALAVV